MEADGERFALSLLALVSVLVCEVSGDCPPRDRGDWEHNQRSQLILNYNKEDLQCPSVDIALIPQHIEMVGHHVVYLGITVIMNWYDPGLKAEDGDRIKMNSSEIWMPDIVSGSVLSQPTPEKQYTELMPSLGTVSTIYTVTLRGFCKPIRTEDWPRDQLICEFLIRPALLGRLIVTHRYNITKLQVMRSQLNARGLTMQRMPSWALLELNSSLLADTAVTVFARLERLPGQLRAQLVQPVHTVAALLPASSVLPPASDARPALLALSVVLHSVFLVSLPHLAPDLGGDAPPRNLVLYRDLGVLVVAVLLQWLLSLRLAARTKPLPGWGRTVARALAVLRTPLLLFDGPSCPAVPATALRPLDEQSVGLSEVLDRLTFLATGAAYLAFVTISLQ